MSHAISTLYFEAFIQSIYIKVQWLRSYSKLHKSLEVRQCHFKVCMLSS